MSFQIGINKILHNLTIVNRNFERVTNQLSTGKKINSAKDDPAAWARIKRSRAEFGQFTAINDSLNAVATSIKVADASMDAIGKTIDEMKNSLESIAGHTPPLPVGDTERTKLLRMYNDLRGQIDQMSKPSDEGAKRILADPSIDGTGDWNILVGPNGMTRTIRKEEVHAGPTGLNISQLADTATDADIQNAISGLVAAHDTLSTRKQNLELDSVAISKAQDYNTTLGAAHQLYAEGAEAADMNEAAAKAQSLALRQQLSDQSLRMLNDADARILQLLA